MYDIRELKPNEYYLLNTFLYEAIFIPIGVTAPPQSIIYEPELQVYVKDFGKKDDKALAAIADGKTVGLIWTRIMDDYGHIDNETPSLAISLLKDYRNKGIGSALLKHMIDKLKKCGYRQVSLSVQKANYAYKMYVKAGFETIEESDEEFIMVKKL